jgi:hypothetical protein
LLTLPEMLTRSEAVRIFRFIRGWQSSTERRRPTTN